MINIDQIFKENNIWQIWTQDRKRYYGIDLEFAPQELRFKELNNLSLMEISLSPENIRSFSMMPNPCQKRLKEHLLKKQREEDQ